MCALIADTVAVVAGDMAVLQPMNLLVTAVYHDGS